MVTYRPFMAIRPAGGGARRVAALPYDVMSCEEARAMASGNPHSFLHVDRAEIDLAPGTDPYGDSVYAKARENLERLLRDGVLERDAESCYYIYRLTMDGRAQTGVVGCASIDDYLSGVIKKHEHTRADKEADRIRHVDALNANTGPIFLAHRPHAGLAGVVREWCGRHSPACDFVAEDGVGHAVWAVCGEGTKREIGAFFEELDALYIADGHHRAASAVRVGQLRRARNPAYTGGEEFNFFLGVAFPSNELRIMDYNRVVSGLNGHTERQLLQALSECFEVAECPRGEEKPQEKHVFGLYVGDKWYKMTAKPGVVDEGNAVGRLDVSVLQERVLAPILGIGDPRTDSRIDFVGGVRGTAELERRAREGGGAAFALFPTTADDLMAIADAGLVMPPKSTWFEPKLRSGLFIHELG